MKKLTRASALLTALLFVAVLAVFCALTVLLPKAEVSETERRRLATLPAFSVSALLDGSYFSGLSDYVTDHFAARDGLRAVNTAVRTTVLGQTEIDGVYLENGCLYAPQKALDTRAVSQNARTLSALADAFDNDVNVYWAMVPDKSDFSASTAPRVHSQAIQAAFAEAFDEAYIDITGTLENDDFYRTDIHWRQERIFGAANALLTGMGVEAGLSESDFEAQVSENFHGGLWGRYGAPLPGETLYYLESDVTRAAHVTNYEHSDHTAVYTPADMSPDPYDVFLSGAEAILEIESPMSTTNRTLVLFRDSFSSSLAPLLLTRYEKIIMIDIRYVASDAISDYVSLDAADDVLFLYSAQILNTGGILR